MATEKNNLLDFGVNVSLDNSTILKLCAALLFVVIAWAVLYWFARKNS